MTRFAFILLFTLFVVKINGQKIIYKTFRAGKTANDEPINSPYVRLILYKDSSYHFVPYSPDCWGQYTLDGNYRISNDSLILTIDEYYPEIQCKLIDTFHRRDWYTINFYDREKRKLDKYTFLLEKDTTQASIFPIKYLDTIVPLKSKRFITDTFYLPKKIVKFRQMKFYKPKRRKAPKEYIVFRIQNNYSIIPDEKYKYLIRPFESLELK